jgi:hypothetical protein
MIIATAESWPEAKQASFQLGLELIDEYALTLLGAPVASLADALFRELVAAVAETPEWADFWIGVRSLVCLDFFALPEGYLPLGLPGPNIDTGGLPA